MLLLSITRLPILVLVWWLLLFGGWLVVRRLRLQTMLFAYTRCGAKALAQQQKYFLIVFLFLHKYKILFLSTFSIVIVSVVRLHIFIYFYMFCLSLFMVSIYLLALKDFQFRDLCYFGWVGQLNSKAESSFWAFRCSTLMFHTK